MLSEGPRASPGSAPLATSCLNNGPAFVLFPRLAVSQADFRSCSPAALQRHNCVSPANMCFYRWQANIPTPLAR